MTAKKTPTPKRTAHLTSTDKIVVAKSLVIDVSPADALRPRRFSWEKE